MDCGICCCDYNNTRYQRVECGSCLKVCCRQCFATYLMSVEIASCMFCKIDITDEFISANVSDAVFKKYLSFKYDNGFLRQKNLLPHTQEMVEKIIRSKKIREDLDVINVDYTKLKKQYLVLKIDKQKMDKREKNIANIELRRMREEMYNYSRMVMQMERNIIRLKNNEEIEEDEEAIEEKNEKKFIKACPSNTCRGFLSTAYKCGTCDNYFCNQCHVLKKTKDDDEHVCDKDIKASIDLIKCDSKPCPGCSSLIYRTEGCNLMWCVSCHVMFDWKTLKIEKGHNHNPEYYRYLREKGEVLQRNPGDIRNCDVFPSYYDVANRLRLERFELGNDSVWTEPHRYYYHVDTMMNGLPTTLEDNRNCIDLRVKYLMGEISEIDWKKRYKIYMKKNEIDFERYRVLDMFKKVLKDLFINLFDSKDIVEFYSSTKNLVKYTNTQLELINKRYKSVNRSYFIQLYLTELPVVEKPNNIIVPNCVQT